MPRKAKDEKIPELTAQESTPDARWDNEIVCWVRTLEPIAKKNDWNAMLLLIRQLKWRLADRDAHGAAAIGVRLGMMVERKELSRLMEKELKTAAGREKKWGAREKKKQTAEEALNAVFAEHCARARYLLRIPRFLSDFSDAFKKFPSESLIS
jgi:hypothetical protein